MSRCLLRPCYPGSVVLEFSRRTGASEVPFKMDGSGLTAAGVGLVYSLCYNNKVLSLRTKEKKKKSEDTISVVNVSGLGRRHILYSSSSVKRYLSSRWWTAGKSRWQTDKEISRRLEHFWGQRSRCIDGLRGTPSPRMLLQAHFPNMEPVHECVFEWF